MSICHSLSKILPVHCLYLQHVFNVNILSIFYTLPKSKMLLESHVLYLLKWKSHPVFPNCCREKTHSYFLLCFSSACVSFITHTGHFTSDTLVAKCGEAFPHTNKQQSMIPAGILQVNSVLTLST